jgi:hypothetical protein
MKKLIQIFLVAGLFAGLQMFSASAVHADFSPSIEKGYSLTGNTMGATYEDLHPEGNPLIVHCAVYDTNTGKKVATYIGDFTKRSEGIVVATLIFDNGGTTYTFSTYPDSLEEFAVAAPVVDFPSGLDVALEAGRYALKGSNNSYKEILCRCKFKMTFNNDGTLASIDGCDKCNWTLYH